MAIEILKESDSKKVEAWDRIHDKRKLYRCERCGAEWKCEYDENKFAMPALGCFGEGRNILCQCCGFQTVKEVVLREMSEIMDDNENCTTCIHCDLMFQPPICRVNGEYLPNPTGRFCNKYDKE